MPPLAQEQSLQRLPGFHMSHKQSHKRLSGRAFSRIFGVNVDNFENPPKTFRNPPKPLKNIQNHPKGPKIVGIKHQNTTFFAKVPGGKPALKSA